MTSNDYGGNSLKLGLNDLKPAINRNQKAEEGIEGLPEDFEIKTEKNGQF